LALQDVRTFCEVLEMNSLAPVAGKLGKLLRMLTSDRDGEIVAAAHAIRRTLESEKLDIHSLAETVETTTGPKKFSEAEAREIYQRGKREGKNEAQAARGFHEVGSDDPSWHEIACACAARPERLRDEREREFAEDMVRRTVHGGQPTEKQAAWLRAIYTRIRK
jgi:hypothetical protein